MSILYISDLDGTLLGENATLSPWTRAVLHEMLLEGLPFTVASARSVVAIQSMLAGLKLQLPIIEFNGSFLTNLETGRHEVVNAISPDVVEDLYQLITDCNCVPFVSSFNGTEDWVYYNAIVNEGMQWYLNDRLTQNDHRWRTIDDLRHSFGDQIVCLTVIGSVAQLLPLRDAILEMHAVAVETHLIENIYSPGWHWLTIHDYRATKDQAIRTLVENYGLSESELVVFGDQINDLKMFQIADRAIAVNNAAIDVKLHANLVIGPNTEDSVARFIQSDWAAHRRKQTD